MRTKAIDLETLAVKLDISPTMHKYAVDRYAGISELLKENAIEAAFYPQGSFRTGTVVRPLKNTVESDFDIDVVCELAKDKNKTTPAEVKTSIGAVLQNDVGHSDKLQPEQDRCWSLSYADVVDSVGLKLDVVPCVREDDSAILALKCRGIPNEYAELTVAITEKTGKQQYIWQASNPKGYGGWFDSINKRFLEDGLRERKSAFLKENRNLFAAAATIEDVPDYYIRSSLQRVIQLLKRHRDIYYGRISDGDKARPISAIITTLAAQIAKYAPIMNLDELMAYVIAGLSDYASLLLGRAPIARYTGEVQNYIEKRDQKWWIPNPVNPDDNYADTWMDETARIFFKWINALKTDLADPTPLNEARYLTSFKSGLGTAFVEKALLPVVAETPIIITRPVSYPTKPWRWRNG